MTPQSIRPFLSRHGLPLLCGLALGLAALLPAQAAGPQTRRLQLSIDYLRDAGVQSPAETGRGKLVQQVVVDVLLHSDGTAMVNNPLDPDDARRQYERGQVAQQRVQSALAKQGRSSAPVAPAPDIASMQARAQQLMAKCGQDRECLMREASAMSAVQVAGGDRATQARLQAYGNAAAVCQRQPTAAARDACVAQARRDAGGGEDEPDEVVETPYLMFTGAPNCRLDVGVKIDERIEGSFQDVQGTVPYVQTAKADSRQRDDMRCPLLQVVLDTRNGRVWTYTGLIVGEVPGTSVRSERGRTPQRSDGNLMVRWHEAEAFVGKRLTNLSAGGEDSARLPAGVAGKPDGFVEVKMKWRFAPI